MLVNPFRPSPTISHWMRGVSINPSKPPLPTGRQAFPKGGAKGFFFLIEYLISQSLPQKMSYVLPKWRKFGVKDPPHPPPPPPPPRGNF